MKALQHILLLLCLLLAATFVVACDDAEPQTPPADTNNGDNNTDNNSNNGVNNSNNGVNNSNNGGDNNVSPVAGQLLVDGDDARSCEVMLQDTARHVGGVAFGEGVQGRNLRRGDRLAVVFFTQDDAPFSASSVGLRADNLEGVEVASGRCFDASGAEVSGPTFTIQR